MTATLEIMRSIESYKDFESLKIGFIEWANKELKDYNAHAKNVNAPQEREPARYKDAMALCVDAITWASDLQADAEDFEKQALALSSQNKTVVKAEGECHMMIRVNKSLKRLIESAEKKLSCLQNWNKT